MEKALKKAKQSGGVENSEEIEKLKEKTMPLSAPRSDQVTDEQVKKDSKKTSSKGEEIMKK